jgi:hypothetical protein
MGLTLVGASNGGCIARVQRHLASDNDRLYIAHEA